MGPDYGFLLAMLISSVLTILIPVFWSFMVAIPFFLVGKFCIKKIKNNIWVIISCLVILYAVFMVYFFRTYYLDPSSEKGCNNFIHQLYIPKEWCIDNFQTHKKIIEEQTDGIYYQKIISEGKPEKCSTLFQPDKCYLEFGECDKIKETIFQNKCYMEKAQKENKIEICELILDKNYCYLTLAVTNTDITVCDKIKDNGEQKNRCEYMVAYEKISKEGKLQDCDFFNPNTDIGKEYINKCFAQVGACYKINVDNITLRDRCYGKLGQCDKIEDNFYKYSCLDGEKFTI